jgi:hypothetical protein
MKQDTIAGTIQRHYIKAHPWYSIYTGVRLSIPPLLPSDLCSARVFGTCRDNAFGDVENLNGALEASCQSLDKPAKIRSTFHVSWSNSKMNCLLVRPSSYSS